MKNRNINIDIIKGIGIILPVLYEQGAWWIVYMFAGIIVPVLLSVMWKKMKGKQEKRYSVVK